MKQAMWFWQIFFISPLMAMKTNRADPSLSDLMEKNTIDEIEDMAYLPNPGTNSNDPEAVHGIGRLAANMEFLMLKVAELDARQHVGLLGSGSGFGCWRCANSKACP